MIWIFLTLLISAIDLYVGFKINHKFIRGARIFDPEDLDDVSFIVGMSITPIVNVFMLIRILILSITNIYFKQL